MWYYSSKGTQLGPIPEEELLRKVRSGEVSTSDLVWKDGMTDWRPLGQVPEPQSAGVSVMPPQTQSSAGGSVPLPQPPAYAGAYQGPVIPTYLWQAICVTFFCCLPFGIVAIVYASKVDGLRAQGNIAGAMEASKSARLWTIVGAISGLIISLLMVVPALLQA